LLEELSKEHLFEKLSKEEQLRKLSKEEQLRKLSKEEQQKDDDNFPTSRQSRLTTGLFFLVI
jgi:hypothetical protein